MSNARATDKFMEILSEVGQFTEEERAAAALLAPAMRRVFPNGRLWIVLREDQDPALVELDRISADVSEISDMIITVEDRLSELKRLRTKEMTDDLSPAALEEVNYTGPDPSVKCAYPPCANRLREADATGPQWCSRRHRELT